MSTDYFEGLDANEDLDDYDTGTAESFAGRFGSAGEAVRFCYAGKATITLKSVKTGARYTYKISAATDKETGERSNADTYFVGLLNGPDNVGNYAYLGRISRGVFWPGRKYPKAGDVGADAPSSKAFAWSWRNLVAGKLPEALEVWHEGACGRCGRKLTVPESIASGFGPECITKIV